MAGRTRAAEARGWPGLILRRAAERPFLVLLALLAVQTVPTLWSKDIWIVDESRHAATLVQMVEHGHWLVLRLGENAYPDKPPLYFWLAAAISLLTGSTEPPVFMAATALTAGLFLWSLVHGARMLGLGPRTGLIAGLILIASPFFLARIHMPRMDILFGALILLSHVWLFRAFGAHGRAATLWALAGFGAAAAATLTKGPLGAVAPILGLAAYAIWTRQGGRLATRPFALGMLALILPLLAYLAGIVAVEGPGFLRALLIDQSLDRAFSFPQNLQPPWFYAYKLPELLLPWSLILFFLPWGEWVRALRSGGWQGWRAPSGKAYVWVTGITTFAVISAISYKMSFLLLVVLAQGALLIALGLQALPPHRRRLLFIAVALTLPPVLALFPLLTLPLPLAELRLMPMQWLVFGALVIPGVVLLILYRRSTLGVMLAAGASVAVAALPYYLLGFGALDRVMSTRAIAAQINGWQDKGYAVFHHHPYELGWYDYHAGQVIPGAVSLDALAPRLAASRCAAIIVPPREWRRWEDAPGTAQVVYRTRLYTRDLAIVLIDNREIPAPGTPCRS